MFVLLGPDFEGTAEAYQRLARVTGLVAYDLKARLRAGSWGVVKALADMGQAQALAQALAQENFHPVLVERAVAHDSNRPIVPVRSVALNPNDFVLGLRERDMTVEYAALACIVRGEVQPGRSVQRAAGSGPSSATFRAVAASTDVPVQMNVAQSPFEAFQAADLHFLTAPWVARIDLHSLGGTANEASPRALDALADELARRAGARVDRSVRNSSVASLAEQATPRRSHSEPPNLREARREQADERFDAYSRIIGEAERLLRSFR
ncbi:MAG: hypothetical protein ACOY0T_01760 [Myxococcota bacterium]